MTKENLIIVPGFGTNSRTFAGLGQFLANYFKIYFIDLPGFSKSSPPLSQINVKNYSQYIEEKINALNLNRFLICGLSFSYYLVNNANLGQNCLGILGIVPYFGRKTLNRPTQLKLQFCSPALLLINFLNLYSLVWQNFFFQKLLRKIHSCEYWYRITLEDMDSRAYFETLRLIFNHKKESPPQNLPQVLILGQNDKIMNSNLIKEKAKKYIKKLLIFEADLQHSPSDLSKEYFQSKITKEMITKILKFFNLSEPS